MPRIILLNDRLVPEEQAVVSVFDHGLLYGDGVFEGLRSYSGTVFRLDAHLDHPVSAHYRQELRGAGRVMRCHDGTTLA